MVSHRFKKGLSGLTPRVLSAAALVAVLAMPAWSQQTPPADRSGEPMGGPRRGPRDRPAGDPERRREMRDRLLDRREKMQQGEGPPRIPDEMINWALEKMKDKLPRLHDRLVTLRKDNPEQFQVAFRKLMPFLKEYRSLSEHRPELAETVLKEFQAEEQLRELSKEYGLAKDDSTKQASIAQQMESLVRTQIEMREKRFQARLNDFEERIKDQQLQLKMMQEQLQNLNAHKDDFVQRRVSQVKAGRMGDPMPGFGPGLNGPGPMGGPRPEGGPPGDRRPRGPEGRLGEDRPPPDDRPPPPEGDEPPPPND